MTKKNLHSKSQSFGGYPKLVTIGEDWNIHRLINLKLCSHFSSAMPLLMDKHPPSGTRSQDTSRNSRKSLLTKRDKSTCFWETMMASDLEVLSVIPIASHSLANHPSAAEGSGLMKPIPQTGHQEAAPCSSFRLCLAEPHGSYPALISLFWVRYCCSFLANLCRSLKCSYS